MFAFLSHVWHELISFHYYLIDYLMISFHREQEKELLIRKKGKRPRGRPRKILVRVIKSSKCFLTGAAHCV